MATTTSNGKGETMSELMAERDRLVRGLQRAEDAASERMDFAGLRRASKALADFDAAHPEVAAAAKAKHDADREAAKRERNPGYDEGVARKLRGED